MHTSLCECLIEHLLCVKSNMPSSCGFPFLTKTKQRRDLFGGDEVEVIPNHQSQHIRQGTIEILVKTNAVIIKSHGKFDIVPKPVGSDSEALIQFHTTTTENIELEQKHDAAVTLLKEKKTNMTGWRTLAIRPAYYEKIPSTR